MHLYDDLAFKAKSLHRLANGNSIHTISALLLQLIQASAFGVTGRVRKLRLSKLDIETTGPRGDRPDSAEVEGQICSDVSESAVRSTRAAAGYLVMK